MTETYDKDDYKLVIYTDEKYALHIFGGGDSFIQEAIEYDDDLQRLKGRARLYAKDGRDTEIWELKYELKV